MSERLQGKESVEGGGGKSERERVTRGPKETLKNRRDRAKTGPRSSIKMNWT